MRRTLTLLVACLGMILPAVPVAASGEPQGPVHLAVGDSQAFGIGTPRADKLGYVPVLNRWLRSVDCSEGAPAACPHLELVNMSVPGATSSSLIANQLPSAWQLIAERRGDADPDNDVIYITVTIGGNDLFNPVVGACSGGVTPQCVQTITDAFTQYQANLAYILGSLRAAAGPDARIVISTYDNPLAACDLAALAPLADSVLNGGPGVPVGFNTLIGLVASATGAEVADMFGRLDVDDWVGGTDCLHPDKSGYHEMAAAFLEVLD